MPGFHAGQSAATIARAHSTKAGTWGLLHVLEGKVRYRLEPPHTDERLACGGDTIVIESEMPYRVEFVEPGRIFVEFYRAKAR